MGSNECAYATAGGLGRELPPGHMTLDEICADFARRAAHQAEEARQWGLSRREFVERLAAGAAAVAATTALPFAARGAEAGAREPAAPNPPAAGPPAEKSRVVIVRHPEVLIPGQGYRVNPLVVEQMLDRALVELTGASGGTGGTPAAANAWQRIGREDDFLAIKHTLIGRPTLHSHTEIASAAAARLVTFAGLDSERILAADRRMPEPYNELSEPFELPSRGLKTRLRRLYTDQATAILNVSVLKCHSGVGISAAMKNHLGSVNNPAAYHGWEPGKMARSIPELNALEPLRTKTRLCIVDAVRPLFEGGPADNPEHRWDYRGLIVGTDPVAVTAAGMRILESKRREVWGEPRPMTAAREMVAWGQRIGLGNADPERIDQLELDLG